MPSDIVVYASGQRVNVMHVFLCMLIQITDCYKESIFFIFSHPRNALRRDSISMKYVSSYLLCRLIIVVSKKKKCLYYVIVLIYTNLKSKKFYFNLRQKTCYWST